MDEKITYWAAVAFGSVALLLLVLIVSLSNSNNHMNTEIAQRGMAIQRGVQLSQTNQALIQALAQIVIKDNNASVKDLLAAQGITLHQKAETAPAGSSVPKAADDKKKK